MLSGRPALLHCVIHTVPEMEWSGGRDSVIPVSTSDMAQDRAPTAHGHWYVSCEFFPVDGGHGESDMQHQLMPAKTEQGRAEIESRSRKLPGGLRSVLLLVDGRRTVAELQELAKRLNAPEDALQQLLSLELISGEMAAAQPSIGEPANEPIAPRDSGSNRYAIMYALMTDLVREQLGVRGYFFQLKLERAEDDAALDGLLPELQAALAKKTSTQGAASSIARIRAAVEAAEAA